MGIYRTTKHVIKITFKICTSHLWQNGSNRLWSTRTNRAWSVCVCVCVCVCACVCGCVCVYMHVYVRACRQELYYIHSCRGKVGWERESINGNIDTLNTKNRWEFWEILRHTDFRCITILLEVLSPSLRHTHLHTHTWDVVYERQQPTVLISLSTYSFSWNFGSSGSFMVLCFSSLRHRQAETWYMSNTVTSGWRKSTCFIELNAERWMKLKTCYLSSSTC